MHPSWRRPFETISDTRPPRNGTVLGACPHDCPDGCSFEATVQKGRLVAVRGNERHPVTAGFLCAKFARAPARIYAPDRLLHPLRRTGPKGSGQFRRIAWDEALAEIAERWRTILAEDSPYAILPFFGSGSEGLVQGRIAGRRFFNRLGSLQLVRTICTKAGRTAYIHTMGDSAMADPTAAAGAGLIVLWGVNPASTNVHHLPVLKRARACGARIVVINPVRIGGIGGPDLWLRPRPGTDAAIALALMHVMVRDGLYDADFVREFTVGFPALAERVSAFPPERAAGIADILVRQIEEFARLYAERPNSLIHVGPGCLRHSNAGMTMRAIACLPALSGAWSRPGCGLYYPTSTVFPFDWSAFDGDGLRPTPAAGYNMIHLGRLLLDAKPPVRSLYVFNGNPAAGLYDQTRLRRGLAREDLFTVVHELRMTDTARFADIILPATTQFEHPDLLFTYYRPSLLLNRPAIAPVGESRSNHDVFRSLAETLGFDDPCLRQTAWDTIEEILSQDDPVFTGISRADLSREGWASVPVTPIHSRFRKDVPADKRECIVLFSEPMLAEGLDPLPGYVPPRESLEAAPALHARYPLSFLTPSAHSTLNSNYGDEPAVRRSESRPTVLIHPQDATSRGISDGDLVRVGNDRGHCLLWAVVTEDVRRGVLATTGQWWAGRYPGGALPNFTTPDFTADMGGGSAFNSNLVEATRVAGAVAENVA